MPLVQNSQTLQGAFMNKKKKDSKTESSSRELYASGTAKCDDPKNVFKFRKLESWQSKLLDSKDLVAAKQWYRQNSGRNESQNCPARQSLSADLASLLSRADSFKFVTPVGALMAAFVGAYLAVLLKPDQSIIASTTIQIMTNAVIAITALIALFVYWAAQRDSEERTSVAFKLMEFSRMNEINTSPKDQKICSQHKRLVPSEQE